VEVGAKGQGLSPHVHIFRHTLVLNSAQAAIRGGEAKEEYEGHGC